MFTAPGPDRRGSGAESRRALEQYMRPSGLASCLQSGAVRLLKGSWLLALSEQGGVICRRQELPEEAFWTPEEVLHHAECTEPCQIRYVNSAPTRPRGKLFLHAVSYGWLENGHPDPDRYHLNKLAKVIRLKLAFVHKYGLHDIAVFWDFPCLFQQPRTEPQKLLFSQGLQSANLIYAHDYVTTWMLTGTPPGVKPYNARGWCRFERAVASIAKPSSQLLDLARVRDNEAAWNWVSSYELLVNKAEAAWPSRPPPITPEQMKHELAQATFTNGKSDEDQVQKLYEETFSAVADSIVNMDVAELGFKPDAAEMFSQSLPRFVACQWLNIWGNEFGEEGLRYIVPALARMRSLKYLWIDNSTFATSPASRARFLRDFPPEVEVLTIFRADVGFVQEIAAWLQSSPPLKALELPFSTGGTSGLKAAWAATGRDIADLRLEWTYPPCKGMYT